MGVKDAGKAEADGVVGGSENCGDVGDGVDELFEGRFRVDRTLGDAGEGSVANEGGLDAAAADVEAEGCGWHGGLGGWEVFGLHRGYGVEAVVCV